MKTAVLLALLSASAIAQTTISDTIKTPFGANFAGRITIQGPIPRSTAFVNASGTAIVYSEKTIVITNGVLSVDLEPTDTLFPANGYYNVRFIGSNYTWIEKWAVQTSAAPVKVSAVRVSTGTVLPEVAGTGVVKVTNGTPGLVGGSDAYCVRVDGTSEACGAGSSWGGITGTLADQADLQNAMNGKAAAVHAGTHAAGQADAVTPAAIGAEPIDPNIVRTDASGNLAISTTVPEGAPAGSVAAVKYYGDGSGLTGLSAAGGTVIDVACSGDVTATLQAAVDSLGGADGGTVRLSAGSCYTTAQLTFPAIGATFNQRSIRITGAGQDIPVNVITALPQSGTVLELRYAESDAKILTLGYGYLEIDHINLLDKTDGTLPFLLATYTTVNVHDNSFIGKTCQSNANTQDAVVLGGTTYTTAEWAATSGFQGYHTDIHSNYFGCVRGIKIGGWGNAIKIRNNTWWYTSGGSAAITVLGGTGENGSAGGTITGNLFEAKWFTYVGDFEYAATYSISGNSFWDSSTTTAIYHLGANTHGFSINEVSNLGGEIPLVVDESSSGTNSWTWYSTQASAANKTYMPLAGLTVKNPLGITKLFVVPGATQGINPVAIIGAGATGSGAASWNFPNASQFRHQMESPDGTVKLDVLTVDGSYARIITTTAHPLHLGGGGTNLKLLADAAHSSQFQGPVSVQSASVDAFALNAWGSITKGGWAAGTEGGCTTATDLAVDGANNKIVSSASYTFVAADVGGWIDVTAGAGWTASRYVITAVAGGAATLAASPAAVGATGGTFVTNWDKIVHTHGTLGATADTFRICALGANGVPAWTALF